ncbi:MAG: CBS domain-containing protein [Saprospiraceae bacterium]
MSTQLVTIGPDESLDRVKDLFRAKRIHHLPVVDGTRLVGLITTSDLFWLNRPFSDYTEIKVKEVMTTKLATIEANSKIGTAAEIFLEHLFHAIPIVDDGDLVGIVTTFDVLQYEFSKEYPVRIL